MMVVLSGHELAKAVRVYMESAYPGFDTQWVRFEMTREFGGKVKTSAIIKVLEKNLTKRTGGTA